MPFKKTIYEEASRAQSENMEEHKSDISLVVNALEDIKHVFEVGSREYELLEEQLGLLNQLKESLSVKLDQINDNKSLTLDQKKEQFDIIRDESLKSCKMIIMSVWKDNGNIFRYINILMFLDIAKVAMDYREIPEYYKNAFEHVDDKDYYQKVIRHCFAYINLVKWVVNMNSQEDEKKRWTLFRGLSAATMKNGEVGKTYRSLNFLSSSEDKKIPCEKFMNDRSDVSFFKIIKGKECKSTAKFHTGNIGTLVDEKEWITLPFSTFKLKKRIVIDAQNGENDFKKINDKEMSKLLKKYNLKNEWKTLTY